MINGNNIDREHFIDIGEDETILVISEECNETMVLFTSPNAAFGIKGMIAQSSDPNVVATACKKSGLPKNIRFAQTNEEDEAYFCTKDQEGGTAICVKKLIENGEPHLKLCKVLINTQKEELENGYYMER